MDFRIYYKTIYAERSSRHLKNASSFSRGKKKFDPHRLFLLSVPIVVQIPTLYGKNYRLPKSLSHFFDSLMSSGFASGAQMG